MHKPINGYTRESIKAVLRRVFRGKSYDTGTNCMYRAGGGLRCAAGCFLPDALYHSSMEDRSIRILMEEIRGISKAMPLDVYGMTDFQDAHDNLSRDDSDQLGTLLEWVDSNVE